jgi:WD40 repeat protein
VTRPAAAAALLLVACGRVPRVPDLHARVREVPRGYVTGEVSGLERMAVLDNKDFVYSIAVSPGSDALAFSRMLGKNFHLWLWSLAQGKARPLADVPINEYVFDVEALAYSPDGAWVVTAGRDGAVRAFRGTDGTRGAQYFTDEPLVSIAFLSDRLLAAGSARGLITLLSWPEVGFISELRVHSDEVRALVALPDGRLVSGGWDKTIAVSGVEKGRLDPNEVRTTFELTETPSRIPVVRAALDGWPGPFTYDPAAPQVMVSTELARRAGIEPSVLAETVTVNGQVLRVARGRTVRIKHLSVPGVDVAVCDACLPAGVQGLLGAPVLERFELRPDSMSRELVLTRRQREDPSSSPETTVLRELKRHAFPSYVNDLSADRAGRRLGVAFSAEKAERNRSVYEREKKGKDAPFDERDMAAIVDFDTGAIAARWTRHLGPVASVAISPDGRAIASGGWDKSLYLFRDHSQREIARERFGWIVRRVRFSSDGRLLGVAAWTPPNAIGNQESDPSAVLYEVLYSTATIARSL